MAEKAWLSQKGILFVEHDISTDGAALDELTKLEVYSTPATLIDGEVVVVGFNCRRLAELLGVKEQTD